MKLITSCILVIFLYMILVYVVNQQNVSELFKNRIRARFQHNNHVYITNKSLECLKLYKSEILNRIVKVFNEYDIKYFIANGNLLEIERSSPILHDDDIDIRYDNDDIDKFKKYIDSITKIDKFTYLDRNNHIIIKINNTEFNLFQKINNKLNKIDQLKWCQVTLDINDYLDEGFSDYNYIRNEFNELFLDNNIGNKINEQIHCDIVNAKYSAKPNLWYNFQYVFNYPLRSVNYLDTDVTIPSREMTTNILRREYGNNYMIPDKSVKYNNGEYWQHEKNTDKLLKPINRIKYELNL